MKEFIFSEEACTPGHVKYEQCVSREAKLYDKNEEMRTPFWRDYNRVLHSKAYRRLKHKTQVFYATKNDHICTRMEHVGHVSSVSYSISRYLGLNTELTQAIAIGHDIGHAPFGHEGEKVLNSLMEAHTGDKFWHEKNSLFFADMLETLPDLEGFQQNMGLSYAIRDGFITHCGEVDDTSLFPRNEALDLSSISRPNEASPYTWEACVVKIADKIAYLGRDIEDALSLKILNREQIAELEKILDSKHKVKVRTVNNTTLMHDFILDLCTSSSPVNGIRLTDEGLEYLKAIKRFNYKYIYKHPRLKFYNEYVSLVIKSIFEIIEDWYEGKDTLNRIEKEGGSFDSLSGSYAYWLVKYSNIALEERKEKKYMNKIVYDIEDKKSYLQSCIHYIASMTDFFAIQVFNELTRF